ncbi:hypothetical protein PGT21_023701 [Puccinia graminis f. sp. tritici]|uniref:Uncharacterized protein n=1 Tax=Puccinia graminis f. sp. tritici TaxID=56615 RepID=A0A5B0LWK1_PUCGR|nr:hypothetical protein PGT21_023701 [Puccinia graminis f. sp. tritici]KAA1137341.1 hypothetical protein PGTUg99_013138 [Puccinia graminis f. sp. tritici]
MTSKVNTLKKKWLAYNNRAESYNSEFSPGRILATPTLDEVKAYGIDDVFWNMGALSHPDEPWAVDLNAIQWAIKIGGDLDQIENCLIAETQEINVPTEIQQRLTQLCLENHIPLSVLQSIFGRLAQKFCRLWMTWNTKCKKLLRWSEKTPARCSKPQLSQPKHFLKRRPLHPIQVLFLLSSLSTTKHPRYHSINSISLTSPASTARLYAPTPNTHPPFPTSTSPSVSASSSLHFSTFFLCPLSLKNHTNLDAISTSTLFNLHHS